MEKGEKWSESYSKFCLNITEIFKGVVWLNMYMLFMGTTKIKGLSPNMMKIKTDIDIRTSLKPVDIILIPSSYIYESNLFYEDTQMDKGMKMSVNDAYFPRNKKYWVYHNFNARSNTIDKIKVINLQNKHYVVALMSLPYESDWKTSNEIKVKEMYNNFQNFLQGRGPLPKLRDIYKKIRRIGDDERFDLQENIENSITLHWVYIHKDRLDDFISEYVE